MIFNLFTKHKHSKHALFSSRVVHNSPVSGPLGMNIQQVSLPQLTLHIDGVILGKGSLEITTHPGCCQCYIIYPARACAARGKVISLHKSTVFLEPIFYLSKYSLSELYFNTDRLLIEFNGLWYSLAARQVFVAIANPDSLLFG